MRVSSWSVAAVTVLLCAGSASVARADSTSQPFPRRSWHPVAPPTVPAAATASAVGSAPGGAVRPSSLQPTYTLPTAGAPFPRTTLVVPVTPVPVRASPVVNTTGMNTAVRSDRPVAFAPSAPCCPTKDWYVTPWARVSYLTASGDQFITMGGLPGSATWIDLEDDIDLDPSFIPELGLTVDYKRHRVKGSYEEIRFEGTTVLPRSVIFHAWTFGAGEEVSSKVNLDLWKLGYSYAVVDCPAYTVRAGLSGWIWTYDGTMVSHTTGVFEKRAFTHVLPVGTVEGEVGIGGTWVARGAARFGIVGSDRYMIELEAGVGVEVARHVGLEVGLRYMNFVFTETTNLADMSFFGPFFGVSYTF